MEFSLLFSSRFTLERNSFSPATLIGGASEPPHRELPCVLEMVLLGPVLRPRRPPSWVWPDRASLAQRERPCTRGGSAGTACRRHITRALSHPWGLLKRRLLKEAFRPPLSKLSNTSLPVTTALIASLWLSLFTTCMLNFPFDWSLAVYSLFSLPSTPQYELTHLSRLVSAEMVNKYNK